MTIAWIGVFRFRLLPTRLNRAGMEARESILKKFLGDGRRVLWRMLPDKLSDAFEIGQGFFSENDAVRFRHRGLSAKEFGPHLLTHILPIVNFAAIDLVFGVIDGVERLFVEAVLFQFAQGFQRGMENSVGGPVFAGLEPVLKKLLGFRAERNGHRSSP